MPDLYDVDAAASDFNPVRVKFRGETYTLGEDVVGLIQAAGSFGLLPEDESEAGLELLKRLPTLVGQLSPGMAAALEVKSLNPAEARALLPAVTEALNRFAGFPAGAETAEG